MIINGETLVATQIAFRTEFENAFQTAPTNHEQYAVVVPSSVKKEQYKWLGSLPEMHEWLDEAAFEQLGAFGWEIENKTYQAGIAVDREDLEDDSLGLIRPQIAQMGDVAAQHPGRLVFDLLNGAFTGGLCYDGQHFCDNDHVDGDGPTQNNTSVTVLNAANYQAARMRMNRLTDMKGRPLNLRASHLIVPPELEGTAKGIVEQKILAGGVDNIYAGTTSLVVSPYLTSTTAWFLMCLTNRLKPFVVQMRRRPQFDAQENPTDENVFRRKKYHYSVHGRWAAGYGLWQFVQGSTGTG